MKDTEAIALPPLRPPERRASRVPGWLWALILLLMLGVGFGAGVWLQRDKAVTDSGAETIAGAGLAPAGGTAGDSGSGKAANAALSDVPPAVPEAEGTEKILASARLAMADDDWSGAQLRYERVLEIDPGNAEAKATLPRIADRLEAMRGSLAVATNPKGVQIDVAGHSVETTGSDAVKIDDVPVGRHLIKLSREGYQSIEQEVTIEKAILTDLGVITLNKSVGSLKVSSQPAGVNYKVVRLSEPDETEGETEGEAEAVATGARGADPVVVSGTTPANLPELSVGRYEISMTVVGWPEHKETVVVRSKRETDVSHVFARGGLQVISDPSGAQVWLRSADASPTANLGEAKLLGVTPLSVSDIPSGRHRLALTYDDWSPIQRTVEVMAEDELKLEFAWKRGLVNFVSEPAGAEIFLGKERVGTLEDRTPFQWEFPEGDYEFRAVLPRTDIAAVKVPWSVRADIDNEARFAFGYGSVSIHTDPPGASVLVGEREVGTTPFVQPLVKPGQYSYSLHLANYSGTTVSGEVEPGQKLGFNVKLKFDPFPEPGRDFTNVAGIKMTWVDGLRGWVGTYEVHQQAYERVTGENPSYFRAHNKPVESVSWNQVSKFCTKLNEYEKAQQKVPAGYSYRLPNDEEWSYFVGDAALEDAITSLGNRRSGTEPVGASKPNQFGLFDVRGNVLEWCEDWYSTGVLNAMGKDGLVGNPSLVATENKFVRGGSWSRNQNNELQAGWRSPLKPDTGNQADVGFRVVLMPGG